MTSHPEPNSRQDWSSRYAAKPDDPRGPSRWIIEQGRALPRGALVCDVPGGMGRHAAALTELGHHVVLVDFAEPAVRRAVKKSRSIMGVVADMKALPLREETFDAVVVTNFLDRDLMPAFVNLLKRGGRLFYETYTTEHVMLVAAGLARGPHSASYLLKPGELRALVSQLTVVAYREEEVEDEAGRRVCASVHARRSEV